MSSNMPRSNALAEADPSSPQELFARDPERYSDRDIDAIILYMRDLRVRIEASGAIAAKTRVKKEKVQVSVAAGMFGDEEDC
jgi:hypothetical protein